MRPNMEVKAWGFIHIFDERRQHIWNDAVRSFLYYISVGQFLSFKKDFFLQIIDRGAASVGIYPIHPFIACLMSVDERLIL